MINIPFPLLAPLIAWLFVAAWHPSRATEAFLEAETFEAGEGWEVISGDTAREASGTSVLGGARGKADGVATKSVAIKDAGRYRIWVRYTSAPNWRGPFRLTALGAGRELGSGLFDAKFEGKGQRNTQTWGYFEADLPEGDVTLRLSKHENKNCSAYGRRVDCVLLTMDDTRVPNHLHFGAQTFVRVRLGDCGERPVYIHIFADHFHAPWYQHYSLGRGGAVPSIAPKKDDLLRSGETTPWCNLTPTIYQDSGAMLHITARHAYTEQADRLRAKFEFATAPEDEAIVRTIEADLKPSGFAVYVPPNLLTPENVELLKTSHEIAEISGRTADAFRWPEHGRKPERFPFFVSAAEPGRHSKRDTALAAREQKTLDYFGFTPSEHRRIHPGVWLMQNQSYCQPDLAKMRERAAAGAAEFKRTGGRADALVYCQLTDEPTGQKLPAIAEDPAYREQFRTWLRKLGKTPADLLVAGWDDVKIATEAQKAELPALYYFSQRFRTRALGDFMATQRKIVEEAYGGSFPVLVNFSDGAVYSANFYSQGVDYFELLDSADQNAIWGEDWSNGASTYQCASFNVDLMRAATRDRGQIIGHHLIAYAGRRAWDIKLKATSEVARGVKILNNFHYGPAWATHEGGPYHRSRVWQARPETWTANAAIVREVGAVEDMLLEAMPAPAKVALLYSSASDAWTIDGNLAYGFDRMHTWLALTHAQIPVDILSEEQVSKGQLSQYSVCYLSGPNLTRAAAAKLAEWTARGGTLWLTAGAASLDEYNRPLDLLDSVLPANRGALADLQRQAGSGRTLRFLAAKDDVTWLEGNASVLAAKQTLTPREGAAVLARFNDGTPAVVRKGGVFLVGFLPALDYAKRALDARFPLEEKAKNGTLTGDEATMIERSANPWEYPAAIREFIVAPVRAAGVKLPIHCDTPLVDAVLMQHDSGLLIPLANYTNQPRSKVSLRVNVPKVIARAESAVRGPLTFKQADGAVEFSLPLEENDFVKLYFR